MTTFLTVIDPREMDLIDRVGKRVDPGAWDDRPCLKWTGTDYVEDVIATQTLLGINKKNRARAREVAIDIIAAVRDHDANKEGA